MAKIGYARVSTIEQNEERQIESLKKEGCKKIFIDKLSGKNTNRPQLQIMLDYVREGDTLIISEYSRLARSTKDLLNIIEELNNKSVTVKSLKENLDTSTPQGKLMLTFFAGIAEFERDMIRQRQAEGIALAKKRGVYEGRSRVEKPENWQELKQQYKERKITATAIAKICKISRPTFYKWINEE